MAARGRSAGLLFSPGPDHGFLRDLLSKLLSLPSDRPPCRQVAFAEPQNNRESGKMIGDLFYPAVWETKGDYRSSVEPSYAGYGVFLGLEGYRHVICQAR